jgi:hypothetical protein
MGIIIIDPPAKPEAAASLTDEQWAHVWRYCSMHTQASMRIEARKADAGGNVAPRAAWCVAYFVLGAVGAIAGFAGAWFAIAH